MARLYRPAALFLNKLDKKIEHRWLEVDALTQPGQVREESAPYGGRESEGRKVRMIGSDRRITKELCERILLHHEKRIRRIILYGSRAQGAATPDSNFDLLVIETDPVAKREERGRLRRTLSELGQSVDVWVMGEAEFEETKNVIGGLAYPAHKYGVVLYEKGCQHYF